MELNEKNVLVGVTGGIAAYKAVEVVSALCRLGANTRVVMTKSAAKFVSPLTFQVISNNPVHAEMFDKPLEWNVEHVSLARWADILLIVPATANSIGKIASGIADDMLSTVCLSCSCPKAIAPAMDSNMWENQIVQENLKKLQRFGYFLIEPEEGRLASGITGKGRLPHPDRIVDFVKRLLVGEGSLLRGRRLMITAGPTQEAIDPVRFITNRSSGKMGYAIAAAASARGARVLLVTGPVGLKPPHGAEVIQVVTAEEMKAAVIPRIEESDVIIKAAAVSDFRRRSADEHKIKKEGKDGLVLELVRTPDILKEIGERKGNRIVVGFAAETKDLVENARAKLLSKNLDMVVANRVDVEGSGFDFDTNKVTMIFRDGTEEELPLLSKAEVADVILDRIETLLSKSI